MLRFVALFAFGLVGVPEILAESVFVTINGNFGPSDSNSTVFDNQDYSVRFTIANPASPDSFIVDTSVNFISVDYMVQAELAVPNLGLTIDRSVDVQYIEQAPGNWLNIFSFSGGLPAGDFFVLSPLQTLNGLPLWNGLAGNLGTPGISLLIAEPSFVIWHLEQIPPTGGPGLPLAVYAAGTATITSAPVPEAPTWMLVAFGGALLLPKSAASL
jgi:hypothetical protein